MFYGINNIDSLELFVQFLLWLLSAPDINITTEIYDRKMKIENWKYGIFDWQRIILGYIVKMKLLNLQVMSVLILLFTLKSILL